MCWEMGASAAPGFSLDRVGVSEGWSKFEAVPIRLHFAGGMNRPAWKLNEVVRNFVLDNLILGLFRGITEYERLPTPKRNRFVLSVALRRMVLVNSRKSLGLEWIWSGGNWEKEHEPMERACILKIRTPGFRMTSSLTF